MTCRFWEERARDRGAGIGYCRRYPPFHEPEYKIRAREEREPGLAEDNWLRRNATGTWPATQDGDWCGEHKPFSAA